MLRIENVPDPAVRAGGIVVRNAASLVSAGTERAIIELAEKSLVSKARSRPDLVKQVIDKVKTEGLLSTYRKVRSKLEAPIPLGYSCAGVVEQIDDGIDDFAVGERVACAGFGYASHAEMIFVPKNLAVKIPQGVSFENASYVTLGAIALQGIRQAKVELGETVAVFGLGLLGQLTVQMLKAAGCRVIGLDIDKSKIDLALAHGIDLGVDNSSESFARDCWHFTAGAGADKVIITAATQSSQIVSQAAEIARDRGHVTVVGAVGMDLERKPFYEKELSLNLSRSYGPGRYDRNYEEMGNDYPIGYVRWTEKRNMEAFLGLIGEGKVKLDKLTTHTFTVDDAEQAFDIVTGKDPKPHLGIILRYPERSASTSSVVVARHAKKTGSSKRALTIGAIGGGAFASGVIFPMVRDSSKYNLKWLASPNGVKSVSTAKQFGFQNATSDMNEILADAEVDAVMILTPHDLHAGQVTAALRSGKNVFVEKPLATSEDELSGIINAYNSAQSGLMVGFNRRYSKPAASIKRELKKIGVPALFHYRINAGFIPKESPLQDDRIGKGRIIGEVCHFIDLMAYLCDARPTEVFAMSIEGGNHSYLNSDNVQITVRFSDGSAGSITYAACGGAGMPKERLEVFAGQSSFVLDDFRSAETYRDGGRSVLYSKGQAKGHAEELAYFADRILGGDTLTEDFKQAVCVTRATFAAIESLKTGLPQQID